jgi:D-serine deaminase-like pyridoxal phosphate-dependent protein
MDVLDLQTPALLIDRERLQSNISSMATKAKSFNVDLRPHIKTHKCIEIARMQQVAGCKGITVSTLGEAKAFAGAGFDDITLAFPLAGQKVGQAVALSKTTKLSVLVDNPSPLKELSEQAYHAGVVVPVLIKVDCGYHRCGIESYPEVEALASRIHALPNLTFSGILTHAGHSYTAPSKDEVLMIADSEQEIMIDFAVKLQARPTTPSQLTVSIGSTPTISTTPRIRKGITEVRPGNYVFFDYTQVALGSCKSTACALSVLATVVGTFADRVIIDAGATALSKDEGPHHIEPDCGFGKIVEDYENGTYVEDLKITALSQEHGKITGDSRSLSSLRANDQIRIVPNHSCLTANLFDSYYVIDGSSVVGKWKIERTRLQSKIQSSKSCLEPG